jgi:PKD repeat protein
MTVHAKVFPNARPIAKAGDDRDVLIFTKVQLNGSASWDDAQITAYNWNLTGKPADSQVALTDETAVDPTFTPDYIGLYKFTLTVKDVNNTWAKDDAVQITAKPAGKGPPTANAGPDATIELGDTVALNGSASADDQSIVLYDWSVESQPPGSDLALQDKMVQNITPLAVGPYVLILKVKDNDNLWSVSSDSMALTVLPKNLDPEAKITAPEKGATFLSTDIIIFDGTQSADPEGSDLVYQWTSSKDGQLSTESAFSKNLSVGEHKITLYVTDDHGHKVSTSINIEVKPDDLPVARLSASKTPILKTEKVTFDGSKSSDAQGAIAQYYFDYGDGQNSGWMSGSSSSHQYKTADKFLASLKVRDGKGQESKASEPIDIVIGERPTAALTSDLSVQTANLPVKLDASGSSDTDGKVAQYYFDFGDGTNSGWVTNGTVTKTYATSGNYQVTVKVKDDTGFESINNAQVSVLVQAPKKHTSGGFGNLLLPLLVVIIIIVVAVTVAIVMMRRKAPAPQAPVQQPQVATTLPPPPPAAYYQAQPQPVQPQQPQYYDQSGYGQQQYQQQAYDQQQYQQPAYDQSTYQGYDATGQQYQQYQQPPQQ